MVNKPKIISQKDFIKNVKKEKEKKEDEDIDIELDWLATPRGSDYSKEKLEIHTRIMGNSNLSESSNYHQSKWFWICGLIMFGYPLYFIFGIMGSGYPNIGSIFFEGYIRYLDWDGIGLDIGLFFSLPVIWMFFFSDWVIDWPVRSYHKFLAATKEIEWKYKEEKEAFFAKARKEIRQKEKLKKEGKAKKKGTNLQT